MIDERNIWADDPANFERLRQNFTTSLFVSGPNMTLPEMSERLCEMRDRIEAQAALIAELTEALRPFAQEHAWGPDTRFSIYVAESTGELTGADLDRARDALSRAEEAQK